MPRRIAIDLIAAARPNYTKIAPLFRELAANSWSEPKVIHTGRPVTISEGTNWLIKPAEPALALRETRAMKPKRPVIELWDGKTASRVTESLRRHS